MAKKNAVKPVNQALAAGDVETLCRNSIDLIEYARNITSKQVNMIQLLTFYCLEDEL